MFFGITNSSHTPNSNILDTHAVLTQLMEGTALVACGTVNGWYIPKVKDIRFYDKATVVFWEDKTKTVVVLQDGDTYDKAGRRLHEHRDVSNPLEDSTREYADQIADRDPGTVFGVVGVASGLELYRLVCFIIFNSDDAVR